MRTMDFPPPAGMRRPAPVRLTRRGRLAVVVLIVLGYLAVSAAVVALGATASRASDPPVPAQTVTVRSGDTLWSIAARHSPGRDLPAVVEQIRRLNGITDHVVHPGDQILVPAPRR